MSEEEKKAIEVMKSIEFDSYEWWYDGKRIDIEIDSDIANKSLQTVLNLIKKYKNAMSIISEICVDVSKQHIEPDVINSYYKEEI